MDFDSSNKRLAKNTVVLYIRMFLSMAISLYISRVTLDYLGVENYGIYNVIGGVVIFINTITAAFSNSAQRFFALALGKQDDGLLRRYYLVIQNIHLLLALLFLVVAELISVWLIESYLMIPPERISAAYIVYHLSVLTMVFSLITIPYISLLLAAEHLTTFAYVGISEQIIKLIGILILVHVAGDPLIWYSSFIFALSFFVRSIYSHFCSRYFSPIVRYNFLFDKAILKDIWQFVSWAYLGSFSGIAKEHGVNIIIGHYFGVAVNAARGVSMQVYNAVTAFGNSFISALRPQIVKSYGAGDIQHSVNLTSKGVKIIFFLMYLMVLPLFFECSFVLNLWLVEVPYKAVAFTELILALCVLRAIQDPIITLYLAIGKIKKSQILSVVFTVVCLVACMIFFELGASPETSVWISMLLEIVNVLTTCYLLTEFIEIDWALFCRNSLYPIAKVVVSTAPVLVLVDYYMSDGIIKFLTIVGLSLMINALSIYYLGLDKQEQNILVDYVQRKLNRKRYKNHE